MIGKQIRQESHPFYIGLSKTRRFIVPRLMGMCLCIVLVVMQARGSDYKSQIYQAYISDHMELWKQSMDAMQGSKLNSEALRLELVNYQYGYIAWCIGTGRDGEARKYLDNAGEQLDYLAQRAYKPSYVAAYRAAFVGFEIGLNVLKAPFIGMESVAYAQEAIQKDSANPLGYIQYAHSQYYMPAVFGGSKILALEYYARAEQLMAATLGNNEQDWNYLSLLTIMGQANEAIGDLPAAARWYQKILDLEPNFSWVRDELYPHLLEKIKREG